jgi:acyl-CoA thioesterase-1
VVLAVAGAMVAQARAPLTIVAFGDSLTAGYGAPAGASYPDFLGQLMRASGYQAKVLNRGESGDTTTDALARLPGVEKLKPDWVILELGGNDGLRGLPVATTRANLEKMIAGLRHAGARVLLVGMSLPPNYGPVYIKSFQQVFADLARTHHLPLVPFIYEDLVPKVQHDPGLLQSDGIHATARGNRIVAATIWRYLRPLLPAPRR